MRGKEINTRGNVNLEGDKNRDFFSYSASSFLMCFDSQNSIINMVLCSLFNVQCWYNFSMTTILMTTMSKKMDIEKLCERDEVWSPLNRIVAKRSLFDFKRELSWRFACTRTTLIFCHEYNFRWFNSIFPVWCMILWVMCTVHIIRLKTDMGKKGESNKMMYTHILTSKLYEQISMKSISFAVAAHTHTRTSSNVIYRITCRPWAFDQEIHRNPFGSKN